MDCIVTRSTRIQYSPTRFVQRGKFMNINNNNSFYLFYPIPILIQVFIFLYSVEALFTGNTGRRVAS